MDGEQRVITALQELGIAHQVTRHGPVRSLEEAAAARGIEPRDLIKTLVVRRGEHDYLFVLVPGDREFSWPKLRNVLGVSRLSMPDADTAREVTGFERGTITPFGALHPWPVIADAAIVGHTISMGGGAHGVGVAVAADDVIRAYHATVADVSDLLRQRVTLKIHIQGGKTATRREKTGFCGFSGPVSAKNLVCPSGPGQLSLQR